MQGAYELLTHLSGGSQVPLSFGHVTKGKFGPLLQQSLSADAWSSPSRGWSEIFPSKAPVPDKRSPA